MNVDKGGVAIMGYDPVAYFADGKPEKGDERFSSTFEGATYRFASAEHKATFDKSPSKYAPQFGGFCAYGVSKGHTVKIDPSAFVIVNGRLLMQHDTAARDEFNKSQAANLEQADENWANLNAKQGQ